MHFMFLLVWVKLPEINVMVMITISSVYCRPIYSVKSSSSSNVYSRVNLGVIHWMLSGCVVWFWSWLI